MTAGILYFILCLCTFSFGFSFWLLPQLLANGRNLLCGPARPGRCALLNIGLPVTTIHCRSIVRPVPADYGEIPHCDVGKTGSAVSGVYPTRSSVAPRREQSPSSKPGRGRLGVGGLRFTFLAAYETIGAAVGQAFLDIFCAGRAARTKRLESPPVGCYEGSGRFPTGSKPAAGAAQFEVVRREGDVCFVGLRLVASFSVGCGWFRTAPPGGGEKRRGSVAACR